MSSEVYRYAANGASKNYWTCSQILMSEVISLVDINIKRIYRNVIYVFSLHIHFPTHIPSLSNNSTTFYQENTRSHLLHLQWKCTFLSLLIHLVKMAATVTYCGLETGSCKEYTCTYALISPDFNECLFLQSVHEKANYHHNWTLTCTASPQN